MTVELSELAAAEIGQAARFELADTQDCTLVLDHMLGQCRRHFWFAGRDLDRLLFDRDAFSDALFKLATAGRHSDIRFLVHDTRDAVRQHHAVHRLAQRLSSYIEVRIIGDDFSAYSESMALFDQRASLYRPQGDLYRGIADFGDPNLCKTLTQEFENMWHNSRQDPNFRQLRI
ncbi:MAG: hypothetical protein ACQES2_11695 [Pseudomonadota bacterium]